MATVGVAPVTVEVEEGVEAALQAKPLVKVEVGVHLQEAAGQHLVEAAAQEMGIGDEPVDAGERFQELDEDPAIQLVEEVPRDGPHLRLVAEPELAFVGKIPLARCILAWLGKLLEHALKNGLGQEVIENHMGKRCAVAKGGCVTLCQLGERRRFEVEVLHRL